MSAAAPQHSVHHTQIQTTSNVSETSGDTPRNTISTGMSSSFPTKSMPSLSLAVRPPLSPVTTAPYEDLSSGVLPDVLMAMRQKIESLSLFDSDMIRLAINPADETDPQLRESRESLKKSSQQSISAAVLVSLAHKRYERRRLAAMEIEKVVRGLVIQREVERVRAILLLLSDDYVRSNNEDARKGGVVALAACAIGMKKAPVVVSAPNATDNPYDALVQECRDLILASVVHACQDHSQRVRYYATESLFNCIKVIPALAIQHFFILFEILRSLYADVDVDVRSGAQLLDKKLKEVVVDAMNAGSFTAEECVPVFARFVHVRNRATKRLTLAWLQELNEKVVGTPILEFLHLFLAGIFHMVADPTVTIRQSALAFLQSVLPKLLVVNVSSVAIENTDDVGDIPIDKEKILVDAGNTGEGVTTIDSSRTSIVDLDKILQSLVTVMEHPDPFVRKVAMFWMSKIVKARMGSTTMCYIEGSGNSKNGEGTSSEGVIPSVVTTATSDEKKDAIVRSYTHTAISAASISVRNSLPHILPGILLSIGDLSVGSNKDSFLPDQTTRSLAEQTNACLAEAVQRDGWAFVQHLDGFIFSLREELDAPGGLSSRTAPAIERTPYRMDVATDGSGIENPGWFRTNFQARGEQHDDSMIMSRLCALEWIMVLYENVVPDVLKADYAREFVFPIIRQLVENPPKIIVYKSLEVLARITMPVAGESVRKRPPSSLSGFVNPIWSTSLRALEAKFPLTENSIDYALELLDPTQLRMKSRDREVFAALIQLHAYNEDLILNLPNILTHMCKLQPAAFVILSFAVELDRFVRMKELSQKEESAMNASNRQMSRSFAKDLKFASAFVQHLNHVLLNADDARDFRQELKDCVGPRDLNDRDNQRIRLFYILLHSFAHNLVAVVSLCLWSGAYRTASQVLNYIDPLDINLIFLVEVDRLVEIIERPIFRFLHVRMLELDRNPSSEGAGTMLFRTLTSLLSILPQSSCYRLLRDRLISISRFRQSAMRDTDTSASSSSQLSGRRTFGGNNDTDAYVERVQHVRMLHCSEAWYLIRSESLETPTLAPAEPEPLTEEGGSRLFWLGYTTKEDEQRSQQLHHEERMGNKGVRIEEESSDYQNLEHLDPLSSSPKIFKAFECNSSDTPGPEQLEPKADDERSDATWKNYWEEKG